MRYCKKCIQPDTRPNVKFDSKGICLACRFAEKQNKIDWAARRRELDKIVEFGKKYNVSGYDCIIGVSGGKDSTRQALFVRDELKMKPLLVSCSYPPEQLTEIGAHNISNLISLGFDCINVSPDPVVWKILMREGFLRFGNWCKSTELALYASAPKIAIAYHIPIIFLGENPAIAFGDLSVGSTTGDANKMKYCHTLKGGTEVLVTNEISEKDLFWYYYPSDEEMEWIKMRIVYLGYYVHDFTRFKNAEFAMKRGLRIRKDSPQDTGDVYGFEALDDDFVIINQMFKYLKFGFGKSNDQLSEAIRLGLTTRKKAISLAKKYDGKCAPRFIKKFCSYIGISEKKFWEIAEKFRNNDIWQNIGGEWHIKTVLE
ncbi:MAG: N-acetyl sugar amidotransferase [Patescibacteria group bacterium]|jgi:N-acetyl sugar amidotransferase